MTSLNSAYENEIINDESEVRLIDPHNFLTSLTKTDPRYETIMPEADWDKVLNTTEKRALLLSGITLTPGIDPSALHKMFGDEYLKALNDETTGLGYTIEAVLSTNEGVDLEEEDIALRNHLNQHFYLEESDEGEVIVQPKFALADDAGTNDVPTDYLARMINSAGVAGELEGLGIKLALETHKEALKLNRMSQGLITATLAATFALSMSASQSENIPAQTAANFGSQKTEYSARDNNTQIRSITDNGFVMPGETVSVQDPDAKTVINLAESRQANELNRTYSVAIKGGNPGTNYRIACTDSTEPDPFFAAAAANSAGTGNNNGENFRSTVDFNAGVPTCPGQDELKLIASQNDGGPLPILQVTYDALADVDSKIVSNLANDTKSLDFGTLQNPNGDGKPDLLLTKNPLAEFGIEAQFGEVVSIANNMEMLTGTLNIQADGMNITETLAYNPDQNKAYLQNPLVLQQLGSLNSVFTKLKIPGLSPFEDKIAVMRILDNTVADPAFDMLFIGPSAKHGQTDPEIANSVQAAIEHWQTLPNQTQQAMILTSVGTTEYDTDSVDLPARTTSLAMHQTVTALQELGVKNLTIGFFGHGEDKQRGQGFLSGYDEQENIYYGKEALKNLATAFPGVNFTVATIICEASGLIDSTTEMPANMAALSQTSKQYELNTIDVNDNNLPHGVRAMGEYVSGQNTVNETLAKMQAEAQQTANIESPVAVNFKNPDGRLKDNTNAVSTIAPTPGPTPPPQDGPPPAPTPIPVPPEDQTPEQLKKVYLPNVSR